MTGRGRLVVYSTSRPVDLGALRAELAERGFPHALVQGSGDGNVIVRTGPMRSAKEARRSRGRRMTAARPPRLARAMRGSSGGERNRKKEAGEEVANHLVELMHPHGVAVHLEATHLCTQMRGVREEQSRTWTSFWRGAYEQDPAVRDEFLRAVGHR